MLVFAYKLMNAIKVVIYVYTIMRGRIKASAGALYTGPLSECDNLMI